MSEKLINYLVTKREWVTTWFLTAVMAVVGALVGLAFAVVEIPVWLSCGMVATTFVLMGIGSWATQKR